MAYRAGSIKHGVTLASLLALFAALESSPARADGNWTGFYAGGHAGIGKAEVDGVFDSGEIFLPFVLESSVLGRYHDLDGAAFGAHAGYNQDFGSYLLGVEGDWTGMGWSERVYDPEDEGPGGRFTDNAKARLNWVASLRARMGLVSGNSLLYGTAGAAWADAGYAAQDRDNPSPDPEQSISFSGLGYVIGGGLETRLTTNLSLRMEALYYGFNLRRDTSTLTVDSDPGDFVELDNVLVARLGLTYHFGGPAEGEYASAASSHAPGGDMDWSGFHLGGHAGYGVTNFGSAFDSSEIDNPSDLEDSILGRDLDLDGLLAGIQTGYDWQNGPLVYGVEGDWTWFGRSDRLDDPFGDFTGNDSAGAEIEWLASLRGRAGISTGNMLLYATGGVAFAGWNYDVIDGAGGFGTIGSGGFSNVDTGYVAGAGMEYAFNEHVSARLEALYYGFGERYDASTLTGDSDPGDYARLGGVTVVRAGLNIKLPVK